MKEIQILSIKFKEKIKINEIQAFRDSIVENSENKNIPFLNYLKNNSFLHKYPLIQFKIIDKKPCIIGYNYKIDEIQSFFANQVWQNKISDIQISPDILKVDDKMCKYSIVNWIALNKENFSRYSIQEGVAEKFVVLEDVLTTQIHSFAKEIGWKTERSIFVNIKQIRQMKSITIKNRIELCFELNFSANIHLPDKTGFGKNAALGYGMIRKIK